MAGSQLIRIAWCRPRRGKRWSAGTAGAGAPRQIDRQVGDERDALPLHGQHAGAAGTPPSNAVHSLRAARCGGPPTPNAGLIHYRSFDRVADSRHARNVPSRTNQDRQLAIRIYPDRLRDIPLRTVTAAGSWQFGSREAGRTVQNPAGTRGSVPSRRIVRAARLARAERSSRELASFSTKHESGSPESCRHAPSAKCADVSPDRLTASTVKAEIKLSRASAIEKAIW
jgi:hypothetical protein